MNNVRFVVNDSKTTGNDIKIGGLLAGCFLAPAFGALGIQKKGFNLKVEIVGPRVRICRTIYFKNEKDLISQLPGGFVKSIMDTYPRHTEHWLNPIPDKKYFELYVNFQVADKKDLKTLVRALEQNVK